MRCALGADPSLGPDGSAFVFIDRREFLARSSGEPVAWRVVAVAPRSERPPRPSRSQSCLGCGHGVRVIARFGKVAWRMGHVRSLTDQSPGRPAVLHLTVKLLHITKLSRPISTMQHRDQHGHENTTGMV